MQVGVSSHLLTKQNKFAIFAGAEISIHLLWLLDTSSPGSQAFGFGLEPHHRFSWASGQQMANWGTSHPPYHVSESLLTNLCYLSSGFWRTLTHTASSNLSSDSPVLFSAKSNLLPKRWLIFLFQSFPPPRSPVWFLPSNLLYYTF